MAATITSEADLITTGVSAAEETGEGMVNLAIYSVEIECLPDALISELVVDISRIENFHDTIHVSDLAAPEGVTILTDPDVLVASFAMSRPEEEEEEEGEEEEMEYIDAESVEVISRAREEEIE